MKKSSNLTEMVDSCLDKFFKELNGEMPNNNLYDLIINEIEKKMISKTLKYTGSNQTKASKILGINRNTLRKKLQIYNINAE